MGYVGDVQLIKLDVINRETAVSATLSVDDGDLWFVEHRERYAPVASYIGAVVAMDSVLCIDGSALLHANDDQVERDTLGENK